MRTRIWSYLSLFALLGVALPASAQEHQASAGYGAGYIAPGSLNGGLGGSSLDFDNGWVLVAHGEQWMYSRRVGFRLSGGWTERPLSLGTGSERDIGVSMGEASLLFRLLPARAGNRIAPYVGVGGALAHYNLGEGDDFALIPAGVTYDGKNQIEPAVSMTAGIDVFPNWRWSNTSVRLEWTDVVVLDSPFEGITSDPDTIHNHRISLSLAGWFDWLQ